MSSRAISSSSRTGWAHKSRTNALAWTRSSPATAERVPEPRPAARLLSVEDLHVHFVTTRGVVRAVEGIT